MEASALSAPAGLGLGSTPSPWLRLRSDEQLVGLFRSGNEAAFTVIHDRYRQRLLGYARQMLHSSADAEDVLQDVFLRAYRALRADERPVSLRAWLYRVAHNRCIDGLRRPVPEAAHVYDASRGPCTDTGAEVERRADLRRLIEDVGRLPDQQRSALLMREMDGMSYADLAEALQTSVPAVKSLLVRARIGLVEALEARDADCADIRHDLAASYDRGVRASGRARRHLRDCPNCTTYRTQLRAVRRQFASLSPAPTAGLLAKLLGLTGAGSGAAAGGAAAGSGTTAAIGGSAAVAASVTKVAAIVCCAAALTGGAVEVARPGSPARPSRPARSVVHRQGAGTPMPAPGARAPHGTTARPQARAHTPARTRHARPTPSAPPAATVPDNGTGGAAAPAGSGGADAPVLGGDQTAVPAAPAVTTDPSGDGGSGSGSASSSASSGPATSSATGADASAAASGGSAGSSTGGSSSSTGSSSSGGSAGSSDGVGLPHRIAA